MHLFRLIAIALLATAGSTNAASAAVTINTSDRGWIRSGVELSPNDNYFTGQSSTFEYRSFFSFDFATTAGPFINAQFRANNPELGFVTPDSSETLQLYDVNTVPGTDPTATVFTDLASGTVFGSVELSAPNAGPFTVVVNLNSAGLAAINAVAAVGGTFSVGVAITSIVVGDSNQYVFGNSGTLANDGNVQLFLERTEGSVPEPTTLALWALGIVGCVARANYRGRRNVARQLA